MIGESVPAAGEHPVIESFVEVLEVVPESSLVLRLFVRETEGESNLLPAVLGLSLTPVVARAIFLAALSRDARPEKA